MSTKKNPKFNVENFRKIFFQLGLLLSLTITYAVIEYSTAKNEDFSKTLLSEFSLEDEFTYEPPITKRTEIEKPKKKLPSPILDIIDKKDNDNNIHEETLKSIDPDPPVEDFLKGIKEIDEPEEPVIEKNLDFISIEEVPIFPGCKGSKKELRKCFSKKISKHFVKKFDSDLPNELGLAPGKKRVIMLFVVDKTGNIIDIRAKAPHPRLQKEAVRIVKLLPKMIPGKQGGKPVGVKYTLPVRIDVE